MELAEWMAEEGLTSPALAEKLGVARNTVNRWRNKWRRPRQKDLAALHEISGGKVTPNDFYIPAQKASAPQINHRRTGAMGHEAPGQ